MKIPRCAFLIACVAGFVLARPVCGAEVRAWEGTIDLPTYTLGDEDPSPPFPLVNRHQIYPYTMLDDLTNRREMKTYRAIYLENVYLKATILPDVGGRLYSLFDKISNREVFYRNNVVKYGLVALRGAWISGGVEFNFPNGHTTATVSPVSSRILAAGPDQASAVVGGMDWVTGMYWQVVLTLHSGESRLEQRVTLFNSTPLENLYWYWANAAVPATPDMQFIYPMREANPHSRTEIWTYPFWKGVDYSWYKNFRQPTSLFGRQVRRNFFGVYYHDSDYGVVHVADFHEVPGKKIWSWGVAGDGLIWTDLLTDHDGPYNEIQSGRYETQLNQEFMPPHRVESWTEYWYPVRGLGGGFVEATNQLALNVRFLEASGAEGSRVELAINPTVELRGAQIRAKLGAEWLREFGPLSLEPMTTTKLTVPIEDIESAKKSLSVEIDDSDSRPLLRWSAADPIDGNKDFVPAAGVHEPEIKPADKMTVEELYLRGVEQEKSGDAEAAVKTYEQALERDPKYVPALLKSASRNFRAANFQDAETDLARANRNGALTPDAVFTSGLIDLANSHWTDAENKFSTVVRAGPPAGAALNQLGEVLIHEKKYDNASRVLRQELSHHPEDALTQTNLAVALRLAGNAGEARKAADRALDSMPLFPPALIEKWRTALALANPDLAAATADLSKKTLGFDVQNYLWVAAWYRSLGDLASADAVLEEATKDFPAKTISPMVDYSLAANAREEADAGRARDLETKAAAAATGKVFPQRLADALVLQSALAHNPQDAHAHYFLGTFLFAHDRYEDAAKEWLQSKKLGWDDPVLERNLGVYAWRVKKNLPQAAAYYEKSIQLAPGNYRLYPELDEIYMQMGDQAGREKLYAAAPPEVLARDPVRAQHALFLVEQHRFDQAAKLLTDHHFDPWEGGQIIREIFVLVNLEKGRVALKTKNYAAAARAFRQALEYPVNLGVGKPDQSHDEEAWYRLGVALKAGGRSIGARKAWQTAVKEGEAAGGTSAVFAAAALLKLGHQAEAETLLAAAISPSNRRDASAQAFYAAGLAERFRNHLQAAQADFRNATRLDPLLWQARFELERSTKSE
ncbi:MAG: DUF5107 domain-containing protein [Terriglobia bacterium]